MWTRDRDSRHLGELLAVCRKGQSQGTPASRRRSWRTRSNAGGSFTRSLRWLTRSTLRYFATLTPPGCAPGTSSRRSTITVHPRRQAPTATPPARRCSPWGSSLYVDGAWIPSVLRTGMGFPDLDFGVARYSCADDGVGANFARVSFPRPLGQSGAPGSCLGLCRLAHSAVRRSGLRRERSG